jgi:hypothetical protein
MDYAKMTNNNHKFMNNLKYLSLRLSYLETFNDKQTFYKDFLINEERKGITDRSMTLIDALRVKANGLSLYAKKWSKYVKKNLFNSNVYYNLPKIATKSLKAQTKRNIVNIENKTNKYENSVMNYYLHNTKVGTSFIYNIPSNMLINKYIKLNNTFEAELAADQNILFKYNNKINYSNQNIYKILVSSLNPTYSLISQPHITYSPNRVFISLCFYSYVLISKNLKKSNYIFTARNKKRLEYLCANLSQLFKNNITLELIQLYKPTSDSNILANVIGSIINKTKMRNVKKKMFRRSKIVNISKILEKEKNYFNSLFDTATIIPSYLSGLSVRIAGRVQTERVIPRKTVKSFQIGSLARSKANIVKTDRFTRKNKRGCFSVTVKTGHIVS